MSGDAFGLQVDQMQDLNRRFIRAGQQFQQSKTIVNGAVMETWWAGPDAARFQSIWNSTLMPRLVRTAQELMELADKIRHEIDAQLRASAAGGDGLRSLGVEKARPVDRHLFDPWITPLQESVQHTDRVLTLLEAMNRVVSSQIVRVAGYTTAAGRVVADYVRWLPGKADSFRTWLGTASSIEPGVRLVQQLEPLKRLLPPVSIALSWMDGYGKQWAKDATYSADERLYSARMVALMYALQSLASSFVAGVAGGTTAAATLAEFGPGALLLGAMTAVRVDIEMESFFKWANDKPFERFAPGSGGLDDLAAAAGSAAFHASNALKEFAAPIIATGDELVGQAITAGGNLAKTTWRSLFP